MHRSKVCHKKPLKVSSFLIVFSCLLFILKPALAEGELLNYEKHVQKYRASVNSNIRPQRVSTLLPVTMLKSENYQINDIVHNDGLNDIFSVSSQYGFYVAYGRYDLARHLSEISAMVALDNVRKEEEFANALLKTGAAPFEMVWDLVTDPVNTVSGTVQGIGRAVTRLGSMFSRERSEQEDSAVEEVLGVTKVKRQYAHKLGVDPYSTNKQLQDKLNEVSWVSFSGAMTTRIAFTAPSNDLVQKPLTVGSTTKALNNKILMLTPEDLHLFNEETLTAMGVESSLIEKFLSQEWLSPRHKTGITMALETMTSVKNRDEFLRQALHINDEKGAHNFQNMAMILASYNKKDTILTHFWSFGKLVLAEDQKGRVIAAVPYDHVYLTNEAANSIARIDAIIDAKGYRSGKLVLFAGVVSPEVEKALSGNGWHVRQLNNFSLGQIKTSTQN
jgi:hypothetical protein